MKRFMIALAALVIIPVICSFRVSAEQIELFEDEKNRIEDSLSDEAKQGLRDIGIDGIDDVIGGGIDTSKVTDGIFDMLKRYSSAPISSLVIMLGAIIIVSIAESYTFSLRYTHTKEIMSAAVSIFTASAVILPVSRLAADTVAVIHSASSLMLLYLPVTAGITAFSGKAITSAGYYAAVITGAGLLSKLASSVLAPLLNIFLSLSVCSGISGRINLSGLTETAAKAFKWTLTFAVSMFAAVTGLNSAMAGAGDNLAGRATKFAISSLIPMIGSSLAEAYQSIQGSLGLLRSGLGVFVILTVLITFAPLLIRSLLWSLALNCAKMTADAFGVSSASRIFNAITTFLSSLRALIIAVTVTFIISSAAVIRIGGAI